MKKKFLPLFGLIFLLLVLAACGGQTTTPTATPEPAQPESQPEPTAVPTEEPAEEPETAVTNAVTVSDQELGEGNTVTIDTVTADVDGWLVIHAQADGKPGPILGHAPVKAGDNSSVVVEIDPTGATETLYAMLHVDAGTPGEYEFPGDDGPATDADGNVVTPPFTLTIANSVTVEDQPIAEDNTVTIAEAKAAVPGWLVIHAQADGKPGPILGHAPIAAGYNQNITVEIDPANATETLYAMLHIDAGTPGEYEFPGDDGPATDADGNVVTPPFTVTGGLAMNTIQLAESEELGTYLTDGKGMALYTFALDKPGETVCYDRCATAWPPLLVEEGAELSAAEGIPGELGTVERTDGTIQVTYNGWPLYYWFMDAAPGDTNGHNVNNVWAVAYPETLVFLGGNDELGSFLVGPDGMTLYRFNNDEPGKSNCYDQCAANWPPLLVEEGQVPTGNAGVVGQLGTTERDDGTIQVTYEGMPLYYWVNDEAPGDATGHGVNNVWFVVPPYTVRVSSNDDLGSFLVGANGMTLYMFTNDEENTSNCYGQCAENWPPLLVQPGEVPVPGFGVDGELGVTVRDDDTLQVTYNGMPLYYWINDEAPGDTTGQGVNDVWFVVAP
jgi:predicted lipoprotein with Yx(FWY)xxD motif